MKFQDKVKKHLGQYKQATFPDQPNGVWRRSDVPVSLDYAFTKEGLDYQNNIIEPYRASFFDSKLRKETDKATLVFSSPQLFPGYVY